MGARRTIPFLLILALASACSGGGGGGGPPGLILRIDLGPSSPVARSVPPCATGVVLGQFTVQAPGGDVVVDSIGFSSSGTGDEAVDVQAVSLYVDQNGDGALDGGDLLLGGPLTFGQDDGQAMFGAISRTIASGLTESWLLVYDLSAASGPGSTFQAAIASAGDVSARGAATGGSVSIAGTPVTGAEVFSGGASLISALFMDLNDNGVMDGPDVLVLTFSDDITIQPGTLADDVFNMDPPGTFGGGAIVSTWTTLRELAIEHRPFPSYRVNGIYPTDPGAYGMNLRLVAPALILDCAGGPVLPNPSPIDIGGELNPRVVSVILDDVNSNGIVDGGDELTLQFTERVTITTLDPRQAFDLPVAGDSLGAGTNFLGGPPMARDTATIVLGSAPVIEPSGVFDPAVTIAGSPSGIDVTSVPGVVVEGLSPSVSARPATPPGLDISDLIRWSAEGDGQPSAWFGYSVASAGDVDGDGFADVIIGAPLWDNVGIMGTGRAYLYLGGPSGPSTTAAWMSVGDGQANAFFGGAVSSAGDVNGDGFDDVVVGARYFDASTGDEGKVYVYYGSPMGLSGAAAWTSVGDDQTLAEFGVAAAGAGDVNGDGYADVIIGAPAFDAASTRAGKAYVFLGGSGGLGTMPVWTSSGDDQMDAEYGVSVAGAGDVDNDGLDDVLVGAERFDTLSQDAGKAYLYRGPLGGPAVWTSSGGDENFGYFGGCVAGAGDVNQDGFADLIVGARGENGVQVDAGSAYLFLGQMGGAAATPVWTSVGDDQAFAAYGFSVSGAGDVNSDGFADIIVGAKEFSTGAMGGAGHGKAYAYLGNGTGVGSTSMWESSGDDMPGAEFGWSVSSAGDVDGNARDEVLIGAKSFGVTPNFPGKVYLFSIP